MNINERLKQRRSELGKTLQQVADFVGVSKGTIQRYESGDIQNVGLDKIELVAKALDVSPSWLLGWDRSDELTETYLAGIYTWINNPSFTIVQKTQMKEHFWELLLKYKLLINSDADSRSFTKEIISQNLKTIDEISPLWKERLTNELESLTGWIDAFPRIMAHAHIEDNPTEQETIQTLAAHKIGDEEVSDEEMKLIK